MDTYTFLRVALHERDILHLDIKPENILFETDADDSRIKITDFGLSKLFSHDGDDQTRVVSVDDMAKKLKNFQESGVLQRDRLRGTVGYMSPELILAGRNLLLMKSTVPYSTLHDIATPICLYT